MAASSRMTARLRPGPTGIVTHGTRTLRISQYSVVRPSRVSEIVADCGELSLVIPQYVEQIYPTVVKGTPFADTKLIVNIVPGMAECDDCDEIFNVIACNGHCPNCNSFNKTVLSGRDFTVREIHVPEERNPGSVET